MRIALITPSLPTRAAYLAEAIGSAAGQTRTPDRHLIEVDHHRRGSAPLRNRMAKAAGDCDWLAFLDDDDILYPDHLRLLEGAAATSGAQVVYSFCDIQGRNGWNPSRPFDLPALREGNYIPVTVLVERRAFEAVGGFPASAEHGWEDHALWLRLLDIGCKFACVEQPTWLYRFHSGSKTYAGQESAV